MLTWGEPDKRLYAHGIDRGVLYPSKLPIGDILATNYSDRPVPLGVPVTYSKNWRLVTDYFAPNMTPTLETVGGPMGLPFIRKTITTTSSSSTGIFVIGTNPDGATVTPAASGIPVAPGERYCVSYYERNSQNVDPSWVGSYWSADGQTKTVMSGTTIGEQDIGNGWTRRWLTFVIPAGVALLGLRNQIGGGNVIGRTFDATGLQVEKGVTSPTPFFTGDSVDELYTYEWLGTPDQSASIRRAIEGRAIAWNGITGFDEGVESGATTMMYRDGIVYLADVDASDFSGRLTTLFYPDEFAACVGTPQVTDGLYADNQKPQRFSFSYRTLVGSGAKGDMFGYQIHLVYNCMASISSRSRKTLGGGSAPTEFGFDIVCTPVKLQGYRPTAHYIIDTRNMSESTVASLESILYGSPTQAPRMPTPQELFDLMNFGDAITVTVHTDGTFTVVASNDNLQAIDDYHFVMKNINGSDNGDGTYVISDGGTTDVILE